ncbi:hypothetical protein DPEC_G00201710 [Dallia pectoralis]|uniref:Uncharacterized protein n=1 Tax=Dallia pectoralis TaxID=75939 RepID=A0ACC2G934_DALPE|nr:hypothetical protein DPEC_G00201710 [Dallia pectoralis]
MKILILLLLFVKLSKVNSDKWSLNYIYTALSKPVELPGIHEFTAMGLMNDKQIDYYDSDLKQKVPRQDWMKEKLPADYWDKGTQSRKSKEQWFKVNVNILMDRMRHNNTDVHILQWNHGCEVDKQSDGTLKFMKGTDQYSYDGDDFLSFDDDTMQWVAPIDQALATKRKWDGVQILNQYTKGYLEKECVDWLNKFLEYGVKSFGSEHLPPKVYAFAKQSKTEGHLRLTCMATGFYPKDVEMQIRKNGVPLTKHDGVHSDGVLPNNDETYQIRMSVQIAKADTNDYDCYVHHRTLKEPIVEKWDGKCCDCSQYTNAIIGIVVVVVVLLPVLVVVLILWRKGKICKKGKDERPTGVQAPLTGPAANLLNMPSTMISHSHSTSTSGQGSSSSIESVGMLNNKEKDSNDTDSGQVSS